MLLDVALRSFFTSFISFIRIRLMSVRLVSSTAIIAATAADPTQEAAHAPAAQPGTALLSPCVLDL